MSDDLISRQAAIKAIRTVEARFTITSKFNFAKYRNAEQKIIDKVVEAQERGIMMLPTIDAVPVVRCKDCFYHGDFDENGYCVCEITGAGMPMHGFCSDGERKKWI